MKNHENETYTLSNFGLYHNFDTFDFCKNVHNIQLFVTFSLAN